MIRKFNSKQLLILLGFLAVVYLIQLGLRPNNAGNLPLTLTSYMPEKADKIEIVKPSKKANTITLFKEKGSWKIKDEALNRSYQADSNRIKSILNTLKELKPLRLASNDKSKWGSFNVNDSTGTRIHIQGHGKTMADLYIGRFSYTQSPQQAQLQQQNPYMQQNPGTMSTYIRTAHTNKVFAVEGFLGSLVNQNPDDLRDKSILSLMDQTKLQQFAFSYPADSSFILKKENNNWTIEGQTADSTKTARFLNQIKNLKVGGFAQEKPQVFTHQLKIMLSDGTHYTLDGVLKNDTATILSSQYPDHLGSDPSGKVFEKLFKNKVHFLN